MSWRLYANRASEFGSCLIHVETSQVLYESQEDDTSNF